MFELRPVPVDAKGSQRRVGCCIVTRSGRERYLKKTLASLRTQPVDILLWANGPIDPSLADGCAYFHQHAFNVGQHVAHNEMLEECIWRGYNWHIRVDDDCWIKTRTWLKRLMEVYDELQPIIGIYPVLGINIAGLDNPPAARVTRGFMLKGSTTIDNMGILGGIFRMSPMSAIRYFRWDERQAMGFGDANQFANFCDSASIPMFRVRNIHATHGGSTQGQLLANADWSHEHDMLQFLPLGL